MGNPESRYPYYGLKNVSLKKSNKYGHLLAKEAYATPWDRLLVDIIDPYNVIREGQYDLLILNVFTMIDLKNG